MADQPNKPTSPPKRRKFRKSMVPQPGAPPGTLLIDTSSPKPIVRVLAFSPDAFVEETIEDLTRIKSLMDQWPVIWVDVDGFGDPQIIKSLGDLFQIHPLALEDVINVQQRSKVERYGTLLFLVARMVTVGEKFDTEQLSLFLGDNFVLTFQDKPGDPLEPLRERIRKNHGRVRKHKPDYLAYCLIDLVTDGYFPVLERYAEKLEVLEAELLTHPSQKSLATIHQVRSDLRVMRRAIWPQREMLNSLARDFRDCFLEETRIYLHDVYDHTIELMDLVEIYRETCTGFMEIYLSSVSNRMNEIMKVLTIISTIFIPLTFIVGVYGMNFNTERSPWSMPELNWYWGYPLVLLFMAGIAIGLLFFFRRKGWLGSSDSFSG